MRTALQEERPLQEERRVEIRRPLGIFAVSRLLTFLVAGVVALVRPDVTFLGFLTQWDAGWFIRVMHDGYPAQAPAATGPVGESVFPFFPLFPLVMKFASWLLPGPDALAGIAVSTITGGVAVVIFHRLTTIVAGPATAGRAAVLLCFFPGSMVLSMPYSEGLMMALAAGCLLCLLERRWLFAGVCAALATASRATALALVVACAWEAGVAIHRRREWRALVAPALAPVGAAAFLGYLWARTGDPLAYVHAQRAWGVQPGMGSAMRGLLADFAHSPFGSFLATSAALCLGFTIITGVALLRRRWPVFLSVYAFSIVILSVASRSDGLRPRDLLVAFPLFMAAGAVLRASHLALARGIFAGGLALSLVLHNLWVWPQP